MRSCCDCGVAAPQGPAGEEQVAGRPPPSCRACAWRPSAKERGWECECGRCMGGVEGDCGVLA